MPDKNFKNEFTSILESILLIEDRFSGIKRSEDFANSPSGILILDSITMRLQIIGEQLKGIHKLEKAYFDRFREIEWEKIMRLRDIISHHYDEIDHEIIFDICKNHIPKLKTAINRILSI